MQRGIAFVVEGQIVMLRSIQLYFKPQVIQKYLQMQFMQHCMALQR